MATASAAMAALVPSGFAQTAALSSAVISGCISVAQPAIEDMAAAAAMRANVFFILMNLPVSPYGVFCSYRAVLSHIHLLVGRGYGSAAARVCVPAPPKERDLGAKPPMPTAPHNRGGWRSRYDAVSAGRCTTWRAYAQLDRSTCATAEGIGTARQRPD